MAGGKVYNFGQRTAHKLHRMAGGKQTDMGVGPQQRLPQNLSFCRLLEKLDAADPGEGVWDELQDRLVELDGDEELTELDVADKIAEWMDENPLPKVAGKKARAMLTDIDAEKGELAFVGMIYVWNFWTSEFSPSDSLLCISKGPGDLWCPVTGGPGGGGGLSLYRFQITFDSGGVKRGWIYNMDGGSAISGNTTPLLDPLNIFLDLTVDDVGICVLQEGSYYIIQAPCP